MKTIFSYADFQEIVENITLLNNNNDVCKS